MLKLLLVRHGETTWNSSRRLQGDTDIPLSDNGRRQARALRETIAGHKPDALVCSPLSRTRETAALLGHPPSEDDLDPQWAEANLGEWAGRYAADIRAEGPEYDAWRAGTFRPPGGEGLNELSERVLLGLKALPPQGTVLVVTHGGPVRAVLRHLLDLDPTRIVPVAPASLTVLQLTGESTRLAAYNVVPPAVEPTEAPD
ncbi:histidine phosphatase family protein [Kineosporia babensis]|uniref:Histidine phosphatase family protein n=1 Tax=Kineosporia babensis TaxID=499548 RepID=A0A9X1N9U0_9ACTN|nr:histidine phosphatase family protein [Kineosporia babensis]MCD5311222.1 histidine phosphatase family protein [Kineosporia babensis]